MEVTTTEIGQVGEADWYTIKCSFKRYDEQVGALRTHSSRKLFLVTMHCKGYRSYPSMFSQYRLRFRSDDCFLIPKGNVNPWRKVWEKFIKQGETQL